MKLLQALAQIVTEVIVEANSPTVLEARCRASLARPEIFSEDFDKEFQAQLKAITAQRVAMEKQHAINAQARAARLKKMNDEFEANEIRHLKIMAAHDEQLKKTKALMASYGL